VSRLVRDPCQDDDGHQSLSFPLKQPRDKRTQRIVEVHLLMSADVTFPLKVALTFSQPKKKKELPFAFQRNRHQTSYPVTIAMHSLSMRMRSLLKCLLLLVVVRAENLGLFGQCGNCHCIAQGGQDCPDYSNSETDYEDLVPILRQLEWENPIQISCDPFQDDACETVPPREQGNACVVDLLGPTGGANVNKVCPSDWSYALRTYRGSYKAALNEGLFVTHAGACGACSSLQDLAVYLEQGPDFDSETGQCGRLALTGDEQASLDCFTDLGFTNSCASLWLAKLTNSRRECAGVCAVFLVSGDPPNSDYPECTLAECLECDHTFSATVFESFGGRNSQNSGLLSQIVRPCSNHLSLTHIDPCLAPILTSDAPSLTPYSQPPDNELGVGVETVLEYGSLAFAVPLWTAIAVSLGNIILQVA
jgi:hypothetical protein